MHHLLIWIPMFLTHQACHRDTPGVPPACSSGSMRLAGDDCGRCHFGIKCRNTRCDYAHPSPALECGARRPQTPPRSPGPRRIEAQAGRIGLRDVEAQIREQVELARALALSMADGGNGRGRGRGGGVGDEAAPRTVGERRR